MSAIHDLIAQISDLRLRERLFAEWIAASETRKFGLVFEDHLPELLPLYGAKPRKGDLVCRKQGSLKNVWQVHEVKDGSATCIKPRDETHPSEPVRSNKEYVNFSVDELLVVREFGEPIFPALVPIDAVSNGPADSPWHTLIEADNYHALQLLDYLYAGKVDCIYIDPPYNSGARDWKYNNDYVDKNDGWRHSKWLAFMEKRLLLAKRLLNPIDSILIVAIDDNELFTLGLLLDDVFKGCDQQVISVTINPKGKARDGRLSQVDEYLIVVYIGEAKAQEISAEGSEIEVRWPYLRRSDVESARGTTKGGVRQFYPIYVDEQTEKIIHIGAPLTPDQPLGTAENIEGAIPVFPIREDGKHMNWGLIGSSLKAAADGGFVRVSKSNNLHQPYNFSYVTAPSIKKINDGIYRVNGERPDGTKIVVIPSGKAQRGTTAWKKNLHDANSYGSQIVGTFLKDKKFPFPKSIYAVHDTLQFFLKSKPNALIVDFFAGSGTTLHALNLLNYADSGKRRCILVTNNEVSSEEAEVLRAQGLQPGSPEWEELGICRSVTWPRSKFSILGKTDGDTVPSGDYITGKTTNKVRERSFAQIGFVDSASLDTIGKKKQFVALINGLPQSIVQGKCPYIVSDSHVVSILFDTNYVADWLDELDGQDHITDFYVITGSKKIFDSIKVQVSDLLGQVIELEEEKLPMSAGFKTNLAYFKLDFLDKNRVTLRQAFREILPLLWLKSGSVGLRPELPYEVPEPSIFAPDGNNFIVLLEESRLNHLMRALEERTDLSHVFIVTDADESFKAMAAEIKASYDNKNPNLSVVQLYRDYLVNFMINKLQESASRATPVIQS